MVSSANLKADGRYSRTEQRIFAALSFSQRIDTLELVNRVYRGRKRPTHARIAVTGTVKGLIDKMSKNHEPFTIDCSPRRGPHPVTYQLVRSK